MIYTVTLNPALDKTVQIPSFRLGEVNRISAMRTDPGGKGINVSKVLRELGEPSVAAAILGGAAGQKIESALHALGIEGMYLFTGHETRTNLKIVDPTLHTNTDVNEPGAPADEAVLSKLLTQLTDRLRPGDLVVLSGKAPAGAPDTLYRDWILACRAAGAAVYLDAEGELLRQGVTAGPALIKPNQAELSGVMGRPAHDRGRDDPGRAGAAGAGRRLRGRDEGRGRRAFVLGGLRAALRKPARTGRQHGRRGRQRRRGARLRAAAAAFARGYGPPRHGDGRGQRHVLRHTGGQAW